MVKIDAELVSKLSEIRRSANLTQEQLAQASSVSRQTIGAIEKGDYNPSATLALRLSALLRTSVHELFQLPELEEEALSRAALDLGADSSLEGIDDAVAANIPGVDTEKELLKAIEHNEGITSARAALETSLSVKEADRMLSDLASNGHLQVRAVGTGLLYSFWEHEVGK